MERNSFMDATSPKDERFETLKQLYPELIRDNKLNFEALKDLFDEESFDEGDVGYNLYWPGKRDAKKLARKEAEGTLEPVIGDGVNEDKTSNIYIEGDNLEVLRCLKKSYGGRVKMIYIDPPYNTGKDFIYPDNFAEPVEDYLKFTGQVDEKGVSLVANPKSSGAYHRRWLDMMLPRLQLARELLTNDGVIFISIDDNEQANLKLLCDEVFGEENFAAQFLWTKTSTPPALSHKCRKTVEYVLCYEKNDSNNFFGSLLDNGDVPLLNTGNTPKTLLFPARTICFTYLEKGEISAGSYDKIDVLDEIIVENGKNTNDIHLRGSFKWTQETLDDEINKGCYFIIKTNKMSIRFQRPFDEGNFKRPNNMLNLEFDKSENIGTNESASKELEKINMGGLFDFPKPVSLLKYIANIITHFNKDAIILDFFSGSATTAHSVMQLNAEDSGNRKFIMVQLPVTLDKKEDSGKTAIEFLDSIHKPHTICEIGKERIRRAGKKILEEHTELKGKLDIGFKVYRLAQSNIEAYKPTTGSDQQSLLKALDAMEKQVTPLRDGFDLNNSNDIQKLLTEIMLRQGFALDSRIEKTSSLANNTVYRITDEARPIVLHVCLDNEIKSETVKNISFEENDKFVCLNSAISDELYAQLSDKGRVETI